MVFVVVLEPPRKLRQDRLCIWAIVNVNVISLERFDEGLGHPVRLRRAYGREARYKADRLSERDRLVSAIAAAVVGEPLHRMRGLLISKPSLDALKHQISAHLAGDTAGGRDPRYHLPIAGIERKDDANALAVPAGDLKAVRRPTQIRADRNDLSIVSASWRLTGVTLPQESVLRHQSVNAFVIEPRLSGLLTLSIEQRPDPSIPVSRLIISQSTDRTQQLCILRLLRYRPRGRLPIAKTRVKLIAGDAERIGHRLHSEHSSSNNGKREISLFMGNLDGLSEISCFKVFLPNTRSSFGVRFSRALTFEGPTTSSSILIASFPPSAIRHLH
jgi:hypothetical protein